MSSSFVMPMRVFHGLEQLGYRLTGLAAPPDSSVNATVIPLPLHVLAQHFAVLRERPLQPGHSHESSGWAEVP